MLKRDDHIEQEIVPFSDSMGNRILNLLDNYQFDTLPGIRFFSELSNVTTRTLQWDLENEGFTYSGLKEKWRFKKAIDMLENSNIRIKEISQRLHYSNVPNFERAFRRWTGTHPRDYRLNLL